MIDSDRTNEWFSQERVPIEERFLWIEGHVSQNILPKIQKGLAPHRSVNTAILFLGFAFADIEIGYCFDVVFPKKSPEEGIRCQSRIVAVTQQLGKALDRIPHGWKTICEVEFLGGVPSLIHNLPEVEGWHMNTDWACISSVATWEAIKQRTRKDV